MEPPRAEFGSDGSSSGTPDGVRATARIDAEDGEATAMEPPRTPDPAPAPPKGRAFWVGIWLIALSFSIFALYPAIPFLSISLRAKATVAFVGWGISWGLFLLGALLAGSEGYPYFKQLLRRRLGK